MEDIYIVTQGQYSDKSLVGAFATQEDAEAYVAEMNLRDNAAGIGWRDYSWERVDFNPPLPAEVEKITKPKIIHVAKIVADKIVDGRLFYRVHCSCSYVSGPLWTEASAEKWKNTHIEGSTW